MKKSLALVIVLLFITIAQGQSKKEVQLKLDSTKAQLDSIATAYELTNSQLDSAKQKVNELQVMYDAIVEKVMLADFNPANTASIIDSLREARAEEMESLVSTPLLMKDTINNLTEEVDRLSLFNQAMIDVFKDLQKRSKDVEGLEVTETMITINDESFEIPEEILKPKAPEINMSDEQESKIDKLLKVKDMYESGLLTEEEFKKLKSDILK